MPEPLPITIRPFDFSSADYETVAAIGNLCYPDHPETPDELRDADAKRNAKYLQARFVAENHTGEPVGCAFYAQHADSYHPRKFRVDVLVHPDHRGRGVGTRLHEHLLLALETFNPVRLVTYGQENKPDALAFLAKNGYEETMREWESCLTPAAFAPAPFAGVVETLAAQGIVIKTLRETEGDDNRDRRLYDLDCAVALDIPTSEAMGVFTFADWRKQALESRHLLPDGFFIAVDTRADNRYIGVSQLWSSEGSPQWYTGLTGVLPEYRGRKIALAMKVRAATYAKEAGTPLVRTWNAQVNAAMLAINAKLGFVREPAWIEYHKTLRPEPVKIRQATPRDYDGIARVLSNVFPEYPLTAEELRFSDANRNEKLRYDRFVIEEDGAIVAVGTYGQNLGAYHPHHFGVNINVLPTHQGRGFGKALFDHVFAALRPFTPELLIGDTISDRARAVRFLEERGFVLMQTEQTSVLTPAHFDPARYEDDLAKVAAQDITIKTFAELRGTDPDVYTKNEALHWELSQDVPHTEEMTRTTMDEWMKRYDRPNFLPDANFFAVEEATGEYVGMTILWRSLANSDLNTGITGVLRSHRKRGIATALKVHALTYAKKRGADLVWTSNEVGNTGMLGINARFGFEKRPDELHYQKRVSGDA